MQKFLPIIEWGVVVLSFQLLYSSHVLLLPLFLLPLLCLLLCTHRTDQGTCYYSYFSCWPDPLQIVLTCGILALIAYILSLAGATTAERDGIGYWLIPVILVSAYIEESIYRLYSITRLLESGLPLWVVIIVSSALFSLIHQKEVWIQAFLSGVFLAYIWYRKKNIHTIAIAHAGYNMIWLLYENI